VEGGKGKGEGEKKIIRVSFFFCMNIWGFVG